MRRMRKRTMEFVKAGATLGMGSTILSNSSIGSASGAQAIGNMSSFMPMMGTIYGSKMALDSLKELNPKRRKRR